MFGILLAVSLVDFFLPLTGRSGSHLPPDLALGVVVAVLVCITCTMVVGSKLLTCHMYIQWWVTRRNVLSFLHNYVIDSVVI